MDVTVLTYPVICFNDDVFLTESGATSLTHRTMTSLRSGWFEGMLIVDSAGRAYKIRTAKKIRNLGFSWHTLIFNPRIEIALEQEREPYTVTTDQVRELLHSSKLGWRLLERQANFEEIEPQIEQADTVSELIALLVR